MNELPTIKCECETIIGADKKYTMQCENCTTLLAHEQRAKEMSKKAFKQFKKWKKGICSGTIAWDYGVFMYQQGKHDTIQALKGEVKE